MEQLGDAVASVAQELEVLRPVLDDPRAEFAWAVRNDHFRPPPPGPDTTSGLFDPLAPNFAARLNRYHAWNVPPQPGRQTRRKQ
jgi:hypothetical protein